jgi:uncharacterized membrane protein YkoI
MPRAIHLRYLSVMVSTKPTRTTSRVLSAALAVVSLLTGAGRAEASASKLAPLGTERGSTLVPDDGPAARVAQLPNRRSLTLAEAILLAQSQHPGRVVRAQTIEQGDGAVHEIRIVGNDGQLHTVRVNARTGAVQ